MKPNKLIYQNEREHLKVEVDSQEERILFWQKDPEQEDTDLVVMDIDMLLDIYENLGLGA